jgi:hypothetical protein
MKIHFEFATGNIARHGDTDVFPFPIENRIFFDLPDDTVACLEDIHKDFDRAIYDMPPIFEKALSVVGYNGFRPAAQLDPLWNAYLLGLVSSIADKIEAARVAKEAAVVYSYRVQLDSTHYLLFDTNIGWTEFQQRSLTLANGHPFVLCCDISDFYPRIYHHRLENALNMTGADKTITSRIMRLLSRFSGGVSYGLPVGGPAARLLSELVLNRTDKLLLTHKTVFCRFVDDYRIFANSKAEAYQALLLLSQILLADEGLTLQRSKTRILSRDEFTATNPLSEPPDDPEPEHTEARSLLRLRLRFDPYSPTAEEDYENLKEMLSKYDIVGMLAREVRKARIDESMTRKLIKSIKYLDAPTRQRAVVSLLDSIEVLYPLFAQIMIVIKAIYADLDKDTREYTQRCLRALITEKSHIISVPTHLSYALRLLAEDNSIECDAILARLYNEQHSMMVRRDIILAMAKHNSDHWLSNHSKQYSTLTEWEKTAMVIASYVLGDEGDHFRKPLKGGASPTALLAMKWADTKAKAGKWEVPL